MQYSWISVSIFPPHVHDASVLLISSRLTSDMRSAFSRSLVVDHLIGDGISEPVGKKTTTFSEESRQVMITYIFHTLCSHTNMILSYGCRSLH